MALVAALLKLVIALVIFNVWILRFNRATAWRGGEATTMREEFAVYGLPEWSCLAVGFLKLSAAIGLLLGFWIPELVRPAALLIAFLMFAAVAMHIRVSDPLKKSLPAFLMFLLSSLIIVLGRL